MSVCQLEDLSRVLCLLRLRQSKFVTSYNLWGFVDFWCFLAIASLDLLKDNYITFSKYKITFRIFLHHIVTSI